MKELEVKILNIDIEEMEKKILAIGGELIAKEVQTNTLLDREDGFIENDLDAYMRIRETKSLISEEATITLTLKQRVKREGIRENIETNVDINDKDKMVSILSLLGYGVRQVGYKERTSYKLEDIRFDIDRWDKETYPYPYMEIEVAKKDDLDMIIGRLKIPQENISTKSIVDLQRELNK